jgi:hypothetical protein
MAGQLLASLNDINAWLGDKLEANDANSSKLQIEAHRLIRGQLASSFLPTTLASWTTPENTPDQIRSIAGKLIAAYLYRQTYSEETTDVPKYAQSLYNEAVADLVLIRSGAVTVLDVTDNPIEINQQSMSSADFWPNNSSGGPKFTMDQIFG